MQVSVASCKKWLATLWLVGSAIVFFIILFQTFLGHYSKNAEEAWRWFLPTVIPTLSLMLGVLVADAIENRTNEKKIDRFIFHLSLGLSLVYFMVVLLTILMQPFTVKPGVELLKQSNLWLAPIQGLVTASLGVFFVKTERA